MSVQEVLARIAQIDTAFNLRPPAQAADPTSFRAVLGAQGQGFGAVSAVWDWAQRTGRATSQAAPGELIVWGSRHVGIVESVDPDGTIHTIEGNSSDAVSRQTYGPDGGGATGYVRLG